MRKLTQEEFIEACKKAHGDLYDYSQTEYTLKDDDIIITCKIHGNFTQRANTHKRGGHCKKCTDAMRGEASRKSIVTFIEQANVVHNSFYDYSEFEYSGAHVKSKILCPYHGSFLQEPHTHLKGSGCIVCARENSDKWGWSKTKWLKVAERNQAKLYLITLFNQNESFLKVGITTKPKIEYRLQQIPYQYEILEIINGDGEYIWDLENLIKREIRKGYGYIPQIQFKGMYECYTLESLSQIKMLCLKK